MGNMIDDQTRHMHFVEQFINGEVSKFAPFLKLIAKDIRAELLKSNTVISKARQQQKLDFVYRLVLKVYGEYVDEFDDTIYEFANSEAEFSRKMVTKNIAHQVTLALPSPNQLKSAINSRPFENIFLKDYLKPFAKQQATLIRNAVSVGFFSGETTKEIVDRVVGTGSIGYTDGIINLSRTSAERMVRTALNHSSAVASDMFYKQNDDVVGYYQWVSTLDSRTSNVCKKLDGQIYEVGKGPLPPAHHNCRSSTVPLLNEDVEKTKGGSFKFIGENDTRAANGDKKGQTNASLNYEDWLKKQSDGFQNEALGVTRAKLFREGKLTIDKFTNDAGKTLTLDELKAKYKITL